MTRRRPSIDLYMEDADRFYRRLMRGEKLDPLELRRFCSAFGITNLMGFAAGGLTVVTLAIAGGTNNYDVFVASGSPAYPIDCRLTIAAVTVGSTSPGAYALQVGTGWHLSSKLSITNSGTLQGCGGDGGNGGSVTGAGPTVTPPTVGQTGGPAFNAATLPAVGMLTFVNNGTINGGPGGGGGGKEIVADLFEGDSGIRAGGGGGATNGGTPGSGGAASGGSAHNAPGSSGSGTSPGAGGTNPGAVNAGDGGNAGAVTAGAGSSGAANAVGSPGAAGGAAGVAVNGDSKVNFTTLGTINGTRTG